MKSNLKAAIARYGAEAKAKLRPLPGIASAEMAYPLALGFAQINLPALSNGGQWNTGNLCRSLRPPSFSPPARSAFSVTACGGKSWSTEAVDLSQESEIVQLILAQHLTMEFQAPRGPIFFPSEARDPYIYIGNAGL
jgi:hypothetical protein